MAHEPIQFGKSGRPRVGDSGGSGASGGSAQPAGLRPRSLDLDKDRALTVRWSDGRVSVYPIAHLRRMSPSADSRMLREQMERNPLTVLPPSSGAEGGPLTAVGAELVGNYAIRIRFSDGHDTGIYSWVYLRSIDPNRGPSDGGLSGRG